jgi:cytochrome c553
VRPPGDPAAVERGKGLYSVNCQFCHGADTRGGDGGPSLLRSALVLADDHGELMAPVVRSGRPGMPKFTMTDDQIADIAAFIHTFRAAGYDESRMKPPSIVVGDAKAGEAYFQSNVRRVIRPAAICVGWRPGFPIPGCCSRPGSCPAPAAAAAQRPSCAFRRRPWS